MKIAIATDWFAPRTGGIEAQLARLADGLAGRGHTVDVITTTPGPAEAAGFSIRRLDVARLPGLGVAVSPLLGRRVAAELQHGYDVVHAHVSVVSPLGYLAAAMSRARGMPTAVTFHSVLRYKRHVLRVVRAVAGLQSSPIAWSAVSRLVADQAREALHADVAVLPNGVDLAWWRAAQQSRGVKADGDEILLVSAMRLHRKKRPRALARIVAAAAKLSGARVRLVIAGDGPERKSLEADARELPANVRVETPGWLPREDLRRIYGQADGFVLASEREAFGIATLEACAAGVPVIVLQAAGSAEFLSHGTNALLCRDDDDFRAQLARFIDNAPLREQLRRADVSLDRYDWSAVLSEHERVYRAAMSAAASGRAVAASA